jgi:23S rRNA (adenine2503-C2)-methyltransferase
MCVSIQSGCQVGCSFCGTGKNFIRNLTSLEIIEQVKHLVKESEQMGNINTSLNSACEKFQIMFMSMGEPMLNLKNVNEAVRDLNNNYYPNAQLLISTIGVNNHKTLDSLLELSKDVNKVGLQFSIHQAYDNKRNDLIPFENKLSLRQIRNYGLLWNGVTGRPVYLNYCIDGDNISVGELNRLKDLFPPHAFYFTFSVVCSADETMKEAGYKNLEVINGVSEIFLEEGYNVRVFNPAGQDSLGGGCGMLWYVQQWMKENNIKK